MAKKALFDEWPEYYDQWFTTPIGKLVRAFESELITNLLDINSEEKVLDVGCGTGVFTIDYFITGGKVTGLDISEPMLKVACKKTIGKPFHAIQGDMRQLPFKDETFDKTVSITALEFIAEAKETINEMFRVTRRGGLVVVATLNSLSPWANRRKEETQRGQHHLLENAFFRSPDELLAYSSIKGIAKTAIHFQEDDDPPQAAEIERLGQLQGLNTGAFAAVCWKKP